MSRLHHSSVPSALPSAPRSCAVRGTASRCNRIGTVWPDQGAPEPMSVIAVSSKRSVCQGVGTLQVVCAFIVKVPWTDVARAIGCTTWHQNLAPIMPGLRGGIVSVPFCLDPLAGSMPILVRPSCLRALELPQ
jgi:hypothetical protein